MSESPFIPASELLEQLAARNTTITGVKRIQLVASSCTQDQLLSILDTLVSNASSAQHKNMYVQIFSTHDILLEGETFSKFCEALMTLQELQELALVSAELSANSMRKLGKLLWNCPELRRLSLAGNSKLGPRGIKILSDTYLSKLTDGQQHSLTHLDLSQTNMGPLGAQSLRIPPLLRNLNLSDNAIGHDGLWKLAESLQTLRCLHTLGFSSNQCFDDGCLEIARLLPGWPQLRKLYLQDNGIADVGIEMVARALEVTPVRELYLQDNLISDPGAIHLGQRLLRMPNLQVLNLNHNKLQDAGCIAIARGLVDNSETVSDDDEDDDAIVDESFSRNDEDEEDEDETERGSNQEDEKLQVKAETKLKVLNLSRNKISDRGAGAFVEVLDDIPSLLVLDLSGNEVSEDRSRILGVLMKHRQHGQQRSDADAKLDAPVVMSPTPKRPVRPMSALNDASFDLSEAGEAPDDIIDQKLLSSRALLSQQLQGPSPDSPTAELPHEYFDHMTGSFSPKRIVKYSAIGNLYIAFDSGFDDAQLVVRSLYMHTAGAMDEARASVVAELQHIQHENILEPTSQTLGLSLYCFLYDLTNLNSLHVVLANESDRRHFAWSNRVACLLGLAKALQYMHAGGGPRSHRKPSFHGDVHPSNIYLSNDFVSVKLSGAGLSRLIATDRGRFLSGDAVFGSRGYRCPRYERGSCQYDAASDMFSYGVIVSEMLTGRLQGSQRDATGLSNDVLYDNILGDEPFTADPMAGSTSQSVLEALGKVAASCMSHMFHLRPSASVVVDFIAGIPID